ncbi:MAG: SGNH/GDSL hydrolase family protein [Oscillospiraceae bacterium]|nr:SGNH/GDSL hydrolase family protein [Oscillospiraceae bacterium]
MKKIAAELLAAFLLCAAMGVFAHAAQPQALKFVVLGDSIAAGAMLRSKSDAYASLVAGAKGYDLRNLAVNGYTSADLRERVTGDKAFREEIAGADIIALSIGGNDMLKTGDILGSLAIGMLGDYEALEPIMGPVFAGNRENLAAIAAELRALNPDARLIVQTLYNPAFPLPSLREAYGRGVEIINQSIHDYLEQNPGAFEIADVFSAFEGRGGLIFFDMTHPSRAGHAVIAAVLTAVIDGEEPPLPAVRPLRARLDRRMNPVLALADRVVVWVLGRVL